MSQKRGNRPPPQNVSRTAPVRRAGGEYRADDYEYDYEYEEEYDDRPRRARQEYQRSTQNQSRRNPYANQRGSYRNDRSRYVAPRRDTFTYIMGGVIGALVSALLLLIFLLANRGSGSSGGTAGAGDVTIPTPITSGAQQPAAGNDVPRIPMADFRKLYDNPATRPIIVDVRPKAGYDEGHIKGAISFPETEVDARIAELPKDKLVIAYCA